MLFGVHPINLKIKVDGLLDLQSLPIVKSVKELHIRINQVAGLGTEAHEKDNIGRLEHREEVMGNLGVGADEVAKEGGGGLGQHISIIWTTS